MEIEQRIKELIAKETSQDVSEISLEKPRSKFGDYAFSCFALAKQQKKNPNELAKELSLKLEKIKEKDLDKIEAQGSYLNFFVNKKIFSQQVLKEIFYLGDNYGSIGVRERALIEHTSLNPNSSPHVGRIRNAIIGDILSRLLKFHGYKTEVHYYVNDVSKQVALLLLGCTGNEKFDELLSIYIEMSKKMDENPEIEKQVFEILEKIERGDRKTLKKMDKIIEIAVKGQREILGELGITYNFFDFESKYLREQQKILKQLKKTGRVKKDVEGRYYLDQSNLSEKFEAEMKSPVLVLTRSNGTGLYPLRDLAYHAEKAKRARKGLNIIVLGEDQKLYFKQIAAVLSLLKIQVPKVVHYSFILLKIKDKKNKMSARRGEVVLLSEFLKETFEKAVNEIKKRKREEKVNVEQVAKAIAVGAIRYSIARIEKNKSISFDWQEALNFEGNSAPYLQYSFVRANSIIKKISDQNKQNKKEKLKFKMKTQEININEEKEFELVKKLSLLKEILKIALESFQPHILANYAFELAKCFNDFYESCPVISANEETKQTRIALVLGFMQVMAICLAILGIPIIDEM